MPGTVARARSLHEGPKGLTSIFMWGMGWGRGPGQCSSLACGEEVPSAPRAAPGLLALLGQECKVLLPPSLWSLSPSWGGHEDAEGSWSSIAMSP